MRNLETLAALQSLASYELDGGSPRTVPLGHAGADAILSGGLRLGALHEVYASDVSYSASACGFTAALALWLGGERYLFWIVTDFALMESGAPNVNGLLDVGVDPERLILLRMSNGEDALRALGFRQFRVRHHGEIVRIEIAPEELPRALTSQMAREFTTVFKRLGFKFVTLDLEGFRSGSMNQLLTAEQLLRGRI